LSYGVSVTGNYSFSKLIESMQYLNPGDTKLAKIVSPYDHKQHLAIGGTYELPIGTGKLIDQIRSVEQHRWFQDQWSLLIPDRRPVIFLKRSRHHGPANQGQPALNNTGKIPQHCCVRHCRR